LRQRELPARKTGVHYIAGEELARLYAAIDYLRQPSPIQYRVEGEGQSVSALMNHGQPIALFAHRRFREKPPSGGVSVLRESIALPSAIDAIRLSPSATRGLKRRGDG